MSLLHLTFALLALLISPGPSNTLLALSGAQAGLRAGILLIPVVLLCYLGTVAPLAWGGVQLLQNAPLLRPVLSGLAALWVARLALGLWRHPAAHAVQPVTARQMALTTLLNPKALIFGLVLIPQGPGIGAGLAVFGALVPLASLIWVGLGAGVLARAGAWLHKAAAVWLALLSLLLAAKALSG